MSPEQAAGHVADKRSDIWSFGVVLFETLTGQRAFTGETVSHVLASVLKTDPNWALVPANTPQPIRRLLRRCLERKPKRRLSDVGEMLIHLEEAATTPAEESSLATSGTNVAQPAVWRKTLPVALGAVVVGSLITGLAVWSLKPSPPQPVTRFSISVPPSVSVTLTPNFNDLAISPDGARVVYFSDGQLYARLSDQLEAAPLRGLCRPCIRSCRQAVSGWGSWRVQAAPCRRCRSLAVRPSRSASFRRTCAARAGARTT